MSAVIYARQSLDRSGEGAAIERQVADCQALAAARGWPVVEVVKDNDLSASTGVDRKGYTRLLALMESGSITHVIVWAVDRLTRRMVDLEAVIELCERTGVRIATVSGDLDLGTDMGRLVGRILASVARGEVERKGTRQRRANRQRAEQGHVGWTRRPYGYDKAQDGRIVVVKGEAEIIRRMAREVLAGVAVGTVARTLNTEKITTSLGGPWSTTQVRRTLLNPRYAGRAVYRGEDLGPGDWPAILDLDTADRLGELLRDPARRTAPASLDNKYLLSGLARCGVCDGPMYGSPVGTRGERWMAYRCRKYHVTRRMDAVDEYVEAVVEGILTRPDTARRLQPEVDVAELQREVVDQRNRRDALAAMLTDGIMSPAVVREQAAKITARIKDLDATIQAATGDNPALAIALADDVRAAWQAAPLKVKRRIMAQIMVVKILPAGKGAPFREEQVRFIPTEALQIEARS